MVLEKFKNEILGSSTRIAPVKVCVIGGAGFIGSNLVDKLIQQGYQVLVLDNFVSGSKENINEKAEWIEFDIRDDYQKLAKILKEHQIQDVYHLAAEPYIPECFERPKEFFEVNANGTLNVLMACKEAKIRKLMYYSSSEVYGSWPGKISEKTPTNPHSTYAVSKLAGDRLCFTFFKEHNLPVIILRQFNTYGRRETHEYVIPEIISQLSKSNVVVLGNVKAKRDFIYVEDAVEMAIELMKYGKPGEIYNLGSGRFYAIDWLAFKIAEIMGKKIELRIDSKKFRPYDVEKLWCDNSKICKTIKRRPRTPIEEGLKKTIDWYYQNGQKWGFEK
ncbi:MAG: NAD-dependent dehydratase [Candidatus Iainarchaeum archaeon]|uniref:NAD-dependent dehydratase n=1 Tax=Candidatus Iainarchaeum sp. TaxID=3101447 RepID=A0A497JHW3_9ARCH|nr:MAG: NAD-dependent dehydratase [Candidatus Diapherotrites archaeon]